MALGQRAGMERDPGAMMALVEILQNPGQTTDTLVKLFTPQEPEMSPEEAAMMAGGGMGGEGLEGGR